MRMTSLPGSALQREADARLVLQMRVAAVKASACAS